MTSFFFAFGKEKLGPVLSAYVLWAAERARAQETKQIFCVMREGRLLRRLAEVLAPDMQPKEIWLSRYACLMAALDPETPEMLENFLWRARGQPLTTAEALRQLGLEAFQASAPLDSAMPLTAETGLILVPWLWQGLPGKSLRQNVAARRAGLVQHLKNIRAATVSPLTLLDFGYAGNVQHALQRLLGGGTATYGLYLVATRGVRWAEAAGCRTEGFLADRGEPEDFVRAFLPLRAWLEQCAGCAEGSLLWHDAQGRPVQEVLPLPSRQIKEMDALQDGILACAREKEQHLPVDALRELVAHLVSPSVRERFSDWVYEENFGLPLLRSVQTLKLD